MVWVKNVGMLPAYVCDSCGYGYRGVRDAIRCEEYCRSGSPNPNIKKRSVYQP